MKHDPLEPDKRYEILNEQIEGILKDIGELIRSRLPKGWGFNLMLFSFGKKGSLFYISNAQRDDMISVMKEWIAKQEAQK